VAHATAIVVSFDDILLQCSKPPNETTIAPYHQFILRLSAFLQKKLLGAIIFVIKCKKILKKVQ
jgi:hypothetical protein